MRWLSMWWQGFPFRTSAWGSGGRLFGVKAEFFRQRPDRSITFVYVIVCMIMSTDCVQQAIAALIFSPNVRLSCHSYSRMKWSFTMEAALLFTGYWSCHDARPFKSRDLMDHKLKANTSRRDYERYVTGVWHVARKESQFVFFSFSFSMICMDFGIFSLYVLITSARNSKIAPKCSLKNFTRTKRFPALSHSLRAQTTDQLSDAALILLLTGASVVCVILKCVFKFGAACFKLQKDRESEGNLNYKSSACASKTVVPFLPHSFDLAEDWKYITVSIRRKERKKKRTGSHYLISSHREEECLPDSSDSSVLVAGELCMLFLPELIPLSVKKKEMRRSFESNERKQQGCLSGEWVCMWLPCSFLMTKPPHRNSGQHHEMRVDVI